MPVGQWSTLTVRNELKERLQRIFESDPKRSKNQKFGSWLDNLLYDIVDHDETVQRYGNFLEVEGLTDNHVLIMDNWKGNHFFVQISAEDKGALFCQEDGSTTCLHVGFCLALPQVYKALIRKGFIPGKFSYVKIEDEAQAPDAIRELKRSLKRPMSKSKSKKDQKSIQ